MYKDTLNPTKLKNYAGTKRTFYIALAADVDVWPVLTDPIVNPADLVTFEAAFTMKLGKRFWKFEVMVRKNKMTFTGAGQRGSKSFINRVELIRTDQSAELLGWITSYMSQPIVVIGQTLDGDLRVFGTDDLPAFMEEFEGDGGADVSDAKETKIIIESVGDPAGFYTGLTVPLTPAV